MKKTGKKNKGFSLVELIVVVLIIGVIGIALAPQVMKWVDASKINTDVNNAESLQSSVQAALADWQNDGGKMAGKSDAIFNILPNGAMITDGAAADWIIDASDNDTKLEKYIETVTGKDYPKSKYDNNGFRIVVTKEGKVTVTCNAQGPATPLVAPTPTPGA